MDRPESVWAQLGTPVFALAAATLFAGTFYRAQYRSPRPSSEALPWSPVEREDAADALLTEDPLAAAYARYARARAAAKAEPGEPLEGALVPDALAEEVRAAARPCTACKGEPHARRTLVLPISVRGGSWPEDREMRVRTRHAAVSALLEEQRYVALESRKLRYFELVPEPGVEPVVVPFEWFARSNQPDRLASAGAAQPWCRVLVLWLDAQALGDRPYTAVRSVLKRIDALPEEELADVCWIGPHDSNGMAALLGELSDAHAPDPARPRDQVEEREALRILSPFSTAVMGVYETSRDMVLEGNGWTLERTIGFDDALADVLLRELELRLPDLMALEAGVACKRFPTWRALATDLLKATFLIQDRKDVVRVAVVSEQDTDYGRYWFHTLTSRRGELAAADQRAGRPSFLGLVRFEPVHYLGGIDGRRLGADAQDEGEITYPRGASQIDYLRRMQAALGERDPFDAVLVLGSNVYDTLMILEALHAQFRDTLFLTVDLDARLFDAKHASFMRNVVVASHLPLGEDSPRGPSPRFRDLYQYSTYRSVGKLLELGVHARHDFSAVDHPRVFEIGLGTAIELNTRENLRSAEPPAKVGVLGLVNRLARRLSGDARPVNAADGVEIVEKEPPLFLDVLIVAAGFLLLVLILITAQPAAPGLHCKSKPGGNRRRVRAVFVCSLVVAGVASLLLFWAALRVSRTEPIEPLVPFAGVSVWPAIAVRVACSTFCLGALWAIPRRLCKEHRRLELEYMLFVPEDAPKASKRVPAAWLFGDSWATRLFFGGSAALAEGANSTPRASEVWAGVGRWLGNHRARALRLTLYVLVFHYAVGMFYRLDPVTAPVRGEFAYLLERLSILMVVWPFLALVFFVLETSFLCSRLVLRLTEENSTSFPDWTLKAEKRQSCLPLELAPRRLRVRLLRSLTLPLDGLVWYPVVAVCLMVAARSSVIDGYGWPVVLVGTFGLFFLLLFLCELNIRRVAQDQKRDALEFFRSQSLRYVRDEALSKRLGIVMAEIERLSGGAFSPLVQHAIVQSAFLPLLAYATTQVLDPASLAGILRGG